MANQPPNKKDVALALLEEGGIFVHLDPRLEGVIVPDAFRRQQELVLQFGLNMAVPIRDLEVTDEGISGTLSFQRRPFWCWIPWGAVFAMVSEVDQRGIVWRDRQQGAPLGGTQAKRERPKLRAVGPDDAPPSEDAPSSEDALRSGELDEAAAPEPPASEGTCSLCATRWVEGATSCPVCGAGQREGFRPLSVVPPAPSTAEAKKPARKAKSKKKPALASVADPVASKPSRSKKTKAPPEEPGTAKPEGEGTGTTKKGKVKRPPWLRVVK